MNICRRDNLTFFSSSDSKSCSETVTMIIIRKINIKVNNSTLSAKLLPEQGSTIDSTIYLSTQRSNSESWLPDGNKLQLKCKKIIQNRNG